MFIVTLTYLAELSDVDAARPDHVEWLKQGYADGVILTAGRQVPTVGGVVMFDNLTREELDARLAQDPYNQRGLASYAVVEFVPTGTAPGLEALMPSAR